MDILLTSGGLLFLLDRWSKRLIEVHVRERGVSCGRLLRITRLDHQKRIYARDSTRLVLALVWLMAMSSAVVLHRSGVGLQSQAALAGAGAALGGAMGNLLDILRRRAIVDFIDLGWWPVFNLADVAIVGGLILACWPVR